jgi:hypothetical protein
VSRHIAVPNSTHYEDITKHLGGVVPCFGPTGGSHMDADDESCGEGEGQMLKTRCAGYRAGYADRRHQRLAVGAP